LRGLDHQPPTNAKKNFLTISCPWLFLVEACTMCSGGIHVELLGSINAVGVEVSDFQLHVIV
jgi:hypothetical protein